MDYHITLQGIELLLGILGIGTVGILSFNRFREALPYIKGMMIILSAMKFWLKRHPLGKKISDNTLIDEKVNEYYKNYKHKLLTAEETGAAG